MLENDVKNVLALKIKEILTFLVFRPSFLEFWNLLLDVGFRIWLFGFPISDF